MRRERKHAANFRDRVILCEHDSTASANTDGQIPESEKEITERWAEIVPLRGTERFLANQTQADITYRVRLRHDDVTSTLTPKNWLKIKASGQRLNIVRVYDPDLRQREIEMECKERV